MSNGVIITAIICLTLVAICLTLVAICWMGRGDKKGGGKHDK